MNSKGKPSLWQAFRVRGRYR